MSGKATLKTQIYVPHVKTPGNSVRKLMSGRVRRSDVKNWEKRLDSVEDAPAECLLEARLKEF